MQKAFEKAQEEIGRGRNVAVVRKAPQISNEHKEPCTASLASVEKRRISRFGVSKVLQDIRVLKFLQVYGDHLTIDLDRLRSDQFFKDTAWNERAAN